ncbi:MAG TPA: hypothetical protein VHY22_03980 [Chthoniobacteraceae bacterium]|jgi:hypothetical protein|nr:hypothetical protein [Chthoniobacteraceae bacterium]
MSFQRRVEFFLFCIALVTYGWFNQGGGWNQNARFAEVRAIVDGHELAIDHYFAYDRYGSKTLRRYPVVNGDVTIKGKTSRLDWVGQNGDLTPVNGLQAPAGMDEVPIDDLTCSGDVSFALGHFHPNKPPGISFLAVPAYFVMSHIERLMHRSPDTWWLMNINAWLTSLFSVGIISALGVVLAFRIALRLAGGRLWPAFWGAVAFGFGTLFLPFATLLFDHDVTATLLVAAFYYLFAGCEGGLLFLAGLLAGVAAITNYVAAVPAGFLGLYLVASRLRGRRWRVTARQALWYGLGLLGPLIAICAYNKACYGSPFALSNAFQNPAFIEKGPSFLGMFGVPNPGIALILLFSPFRGIFYGAPILFMGVYGLWRMRRVFRLEMALFIGIGLVFFLVNSSFMGWHAGFSCGPRYLIPATAFLALPAVYGFMQWPRISAALLAVSIGINFLFTVTDAESPIGVGSLAMAGDREMYLYSPLTEYAAPLFFEGRAWPVLNMLIADRVEDMREDLDVRRVPAAAQAADIAKLKADFAKSIAAGSDQMLDLASYCGPVSVNPTGVCEGGYYSLYTAGSLQARWNSFNVGEFWFPQSRWSVLPLLALVGMLAAGLAREASRAAASRRRGSFEEFAIPAEEIAAD